MIFQLYFSQLLIYVYNLWIIYLHYMTIYRSNFYHQMAFRKEANLYIYLYIDKSLWTVQFVPHLVWLLIRVINYLQIDQYSKLLVFSRVFLWNRNSFLLVLIILILLSPLKKLETIISPHHTNIMQNSLI